MDYIDIEEARARSGLRLVLTAGVPGPWSEAAKYLFHVKGITYTPVRQVPGRSDAALAAWTAQTSAPVALLDDERPRSGWADILALAERLAPKPALVPTELQDRVRMFGLLNELAGEQGFGWQRRLTLLKPALDAGAGGVAALLADRYGYAPEAAAAAPSRVADILRAFAAQLETQRAAGSEYLVGAELSALDLYWAAFAAMIEPLPPDLCPMPEPLRAGYTMREPELRALVPPALLEHRDRIYRRWLELPLDF